MVAVVLYGALAAGLVAAHGVDSLPNVGRALATHRGISPAIDSHLDVRGRGYDGQFFLAIALDPARARHYVDVPQYRYSHILYPMLARAVALGREAWIPAALILVNLIAVGAGTFCVATLLARSALPPALAALYFLFPGLLTAFAEDLSEPLAYGLAALGLLLLAGRRSPSRVAAAAAVFALAGLARETTLLIAVTVAVVHVARSPREPGQLRRAAGFVTVAVLPYLAWRAFLAAWLGSAAAHPGLTVGVIPFSGLIEATRLDVWPVLGVAVPATALGLACLLRLRNAWRDETFAALGVSLVLLAVYLPAESYRAYESAGRLQIGAVLLALVSLPALRAKQTDPLLAGAVLVA
ncbi:MAG: hypothetical protein ACXVYM_09345, partial [Gaiellaceae bacterium]